MLLRSDLSFEPGAGFGDQVPSGIFLPLQTQVCPIRIFSKDELQLLLTPPALDLFLAPLFALATRPYSSYHTSMSNTYRAVKLCGYNFCLCSMTRLARSSVKPTYSLRDLFETM